MTRTARIVRNTFLTLALAAILLAAMPDIASAAQNAPGAGDHKASLVRGSAEGLITGITTLVVFVLLVVVLGKFAWGPIANGLKAREDKIRNDIADAEAARARAEGTLKEYNARLATAEGQVRDMLAKAVGEAQQVADRIKSQASQDAQAIKERNERDIEAAKDRAVAEIYDQAATLSTSVAEKILRRNLNADDQRDLVSRSLELLRQQSAGGNGNGNGVGQN